MLAQHTHKNDMKECHPYVYPPNPAQATSYRTFYPQHYGFPVSHNVSGEWLVTPASIKAV